MQKIAIITDSASDLSNDIINKYNIKVAPFRIIYKDNEYEDMITITANEVYKRLPIEIPTTSLPNIERIDKIINDIEDEGYTHVLAINISSNLSGTGNSIRLLLEEHPKLKSFVFDTKTLSMAQGAIVIEAAKMIEAGDTFESIIMKLPEIRKKTHVYFTLNTLEYLKKGGRIGGASALFGSLLQIKPILTVEDGKTTVFTKVRTKKKAIDKIVNTILEQNSKTPIKGLIVHHINCESEGQELADRLKSSLGLDNVKIQSIGPIIGLHVGPGSIGVAYHY